MAAKKTTAPKFKKLKEKRPPRQVFVLYDPLTACVTGTFPKKKDALDECLSDERVAGPYVLAERVGQR